MHNNIPLDSYADRLNELGITIKPLEYRRLEFDIILMFKIYHNLSDLPFDKYFEHCIIQIFSRQRGVVVRSVVFTTTMIARLMVPLPT